MIRTDKNYYRVLQVDPLADAEVITAAYLVLKQKYLLNKDGLEESEKKMSILDEAYRILGDVTKRAQYDKILWDD